MNWRLTKYRNGMDMTNLKRLREISKYNSNYYVGIDNDLLFALSDDDNTTEWFLISGLNTYFIGNSYTSEGDLLERLAERHT